ncbi:uncharacterized protein LOC131678801 [Topomyia yanbarensis]|uniref:uncharacterized protein LOC131678801 n=1 Tax=Topomyia yanbarensis TaxID=2498891 RepID=UPI00273A7B48|nr:uncharacterized protein LOC131678801 [Topomyia yanbarensis]
MISSKLFCVLLLFTIYVQKSSTFPLLDYFNSDPDGNPVARDVEETSTALAEIATESDSPRGPLIQYDTVVPVLKVVLTPIGRILQPLIERWIADRLGPYVESIGRAMEGFSRFATEHVSFQTGDTYYTKSDLIDGYGYNSLIITLASGRTFTVLTHKSNRKMNILDEFPQLSEALNEVRKLQ